MIYAEKNIARISEEKICQVEWYAKQVLENWLRNGHSERNLGYYNDDSGLSPVQWHTVKYTKLDQ